jgi:hypothetical protein
MEVITTATSNTLQFNWTATILNVKDANSIIL